MSDKTIHLSLPLVEELLKYLTIYIGYVQEQENLSDDMKNLGVCATETVDRAVQTVIAHNYRNN